MCIVPYTYDSARHFFGAIAVRLQIRLREDERDIQGIICDELQVSKAQENATLELRKKDRYFQILSWCCSSGTVVHIIFGILVFSSILFITTFDAIFVVLRVLGSTIVCRMILMYGKTCYLLLSRMKQQLTILASSNRAEWDERQGRHLRGQQRPRRFYFVKKFRSCLQDPLCVF